MQREAYTTIRISHETWRALQQERKPRESLEAVLLRKMQGRRS